MVNQHGGTGPGSGERRPDDRPPLDPPGRPAGGGRDPGERPAAGRPGEPAGRPPAGGPAGERGPGSPPPERTGPGFGRRHWRGLAILAAVVIAFLVGFLWQFARAQRATGELEATRIELEFSRMEAMLGAAAVAAEHGHYETGRVLASRFFTSLAGRTGHPRVEDPEQMRAVMTQRDATITALSRGTAGSGELLAQLLIRFRVGLNGPEHAIPIPGTDEPTPQP